MDEKLQSLLRFEERERMKEMEIQEDELRMIKNDYKHLRRTPWAGMEVPVIGLDSIRWHQVSLPLPDSSYVSSSPIAPLTEDAASCFLVGQTYLVWRIHKDLPHALELLELNANRKLPRNGLRIIFPVPLCPFAFICKDEISGTPGNPYLMHALTITGVAYLFKLRSLYTYISHTVISKIDFVEFNLQTYPNIGRITAVAATPGRLLVGKTDGSICIFQLGMDDRTAPGFLQELRGEDTSLWGLMTSLLYRNRTPGYVLDLVITELNGRKVLFVLNIDGVVHAWDMSNHCCIFYNTMSNASWSSFRAGGTPLKLWVGEIDRDTRMIQLSISYKLKDPSMKPFIIYYLSYKEGNRIKLSLKNKFRSIPLREVESHDMKLTPKKVWEDIIDMKLTPKKVWVITKDGIILIHLRSSLYVPYEIEYHVPQDIFVADQLFQLNGYHWDDLLSITRSIFSSDKGEAVAFVTSMCLRRLLQPGVYNYIVLRATIQDYNKNWADSDFESLTVDQIRKEITSLIAHEAKDESLTSIFNGWKLFFTRYLHHWRKSSALFGMFVESSTGAVCLIRKHSLSLFRCLKDIELLIHGSIEKVGGAGLVLVHDLAKDRTIYEILVCANYISRYIGRSASAICYESLVQTTSSSEEIISLIVKMLETGYSSSLLVSETQREFAVGMLLALQKLSKIGTTWSNVLNALQSYLEVLAPQKTFQNFDSEVLFNINTSVCVQSTIQVAKMMFESAFDILLLLRYLVSNSAQIHMSHTEVTRIQRELVPKVQEIMTEWLIVHYIGTTPSQCSALEDSCSQLSSLQIVFAVGNFDRKSWNEKLEKCNFTLSFLLLLDTKSTSALDKHYYSTRSLPTPQNCIHSVCDFTSWVVWGKNNAGEEPPFFFRHSTKLALILLQHGQYDAVEILFRLVDTLSSRGDTHGYNCDHCERCTLSHLMGCTLLAQAHFGLDGLLKERKISEAVHCFFRAAAGQVVPESLLNLYGDTISPPYLRLIDYESIAAWKVQYYQWVMQIFEQYNISDGASMFAHAALEQVDEAYGGEAPSESASAIKERLWTHVFKLSA